MSRGASPLRVDRVLGPTAPEPATQSPPIRVTPAWRTETIGRATLILGDCREVLPRLQPAACVVSDPPYGMDYKSGHNSSRKGRGAKLVRKSGNFAPIAGDKEPFDPAFLLGLGVPTILWGANYFCDRLPAGTRWLIWDKLAGKATFPSGSDVELAWTSIPGPDKLFSHLWRGQMRAGEENIVHSPKLHPNQKPAALMAWCLGFMPAGAVLDPFMGSGSTGVAAVRDNRDFIGVELNEVYFDIACDRIDKAQRQGNLFEVAA